MSVQRNLCKGIYSLPIKAELPKTKLLYTVFNMVILGFRPKKGCKIICRPPTIVGDQLRRGGKCAGLNPLPRTIQGNDPGTTACPPCAG